MNPHRSHGGLEPGPGARVVIIDDDLEFLEDASELLRAEGFQVTGSHRARLAFRLIRRLLPEAVILDHDMPGATGIDVLREIRSASLTRDLPVLFLTAHGTRELLARGFQDGLDDFLTKPFRSEELVLRLNAVIERFRLSRARVTLDDLGAALAAGGPLFAIQAPGLSELRGSEAQGLLPRLETTLDRVAFRIRDRLAAGIPDRAAAVRRRGDLLFVGYTPGHARRSSDGSSDTPGSSDDRRDLVRLLAAANRLLPTGTFLAATDEGLRSRPLPRLRLFEIRATPPRSIEASELLRLLELELAPMRVGEAAESYRVVRI